jgi:AraC family transcriptional regulator
MADLNLHTLFAGTIARVTDVCCQAPASGCGEEEVSPAHQLIFTRRGAFVKHTGAGGRREVVGEPLHALFLNRGESYRVSHPASGGDDCTTLWFSPEGAAEVAAAVGCADAAGNGFTITHAPVSLELLVRYRSLRATLAADAGGLAADEEAMDVLAASLRAGRAAHGGHPPRRRSGTQRQHRDLVEHAKEILAARPGERRTLEGLAREVYSSPFHLTRLFRAQLGMPVHQYLMRLRLAVALERMEQGERSLSTLALELGFASHSHFSDAFRRAFGVPPSRFATVRSL